MGEATKNLIKSKRVTMEICGSNPKASSTRVEDDKSSTTNKKRIEFTICTKNKPVWVPATKIAKNAEISQLVVKNE